MRLHNTLTGKVEEFTPLTPGHLGLYVCGVTPYAESHIGHAMSAIVYDVLVRYLRWPGNSFGGLDVRYVSNYTDIDDKIIDRARELGIGSDRLATDNIDQWEREQRLLGLVSPDVRPLVTTHIPEIIALTQRLVANGHAYSTPSGDVYFRVRTDDDYGKLSHRNIEDMRAGTRSESGEEKEFPLDFALWKSAKPDEPSWDSPWGAGRPGWHIECSAMAQRYLGETFDIHGGGIDLLFPHHENEVAQSESATGQPFARFWMHNGLVQRDGEKMSKSLGNFVTVREALQFGQNSQVPIDEIIVADAIRYFALSSHYRSSNNWTDEAIGAAQRRIQRIREALDAYRQVNEMAPHLDSGAVDEIGRGFLPIRLAFIEAMESDLHTPRALAALSPLITALERHRGTVSQASFERGQVLLREFLGVLGFRIANERHIAVSDAVTATERLDIVALSKLAKQYAVVCGGADAASTIEALLAHREEARKTREFAVADGIRNGLAAAGVEIEDTPSGPRWSAKR